MAAVPVSVLEKLRQLIYTFLWSGCREKKRLHLCNWDSIARPKKVGGWGIKNLAFFNKSLAEKSLWRGLTTEGIWKKVLKDKYLPYVSVSMWFRLELRSQGETSPVWRNLLKSLPLLDHWLCWKSGNGETIQAGRDQIMGMGNNSFLSQALLTALKDRGITFLYQARNTSLNAPLNTYWIDVNQLGINGDLAKEWEQYRRALAGAGILLAPTEDELRWSGGDGSGFPTAKNLYRALSESMWAPTIRGWGYKLWKWNLALKLKLFFWLLLKTKFLRGMFCLLEVGKVRVIVSCVDVTRSLYTICLFLVLSLARFGFY
jgi:hypothetical protein